MTSAAARILPSALTLFVGWRIYRRFQRSVGRQPLRPSSLTWRLVIFALLTAWVGAGAWNYPHLLFGFGGGLLLGAGLGAIALRLTRFETAPEGRHFYTPNTHIGLAVTLLLAGRIAYRVITVYAAASDDGGGLASLQVIQSPLTLCLLGLTTGYYLVYYAGLLWHARAKT
ncbi:MAG TPA: hypothetical protein VG838_00195 [Opitutaceae bacterium]|nr:hypothetical protein [Opitutaceae bacterium]